MCLFFNALGIQAHKNMEPLVPFALTNHGLLHFAVEEFEKKMNKYSII